MRCAGVVLTSAYQPEAAPVFQTVVSESGSVGVRSIGLSNESVSSMSDVVWFTVAPLSLQQVLWSFDNSSSETNGTGVCPVVLCVCMSVHVCVYAVCMCMCVHVCACVCVCMCVCMLRVRMCVHVCRRVRDHVSARVLHDTAVG